MPDPWMWVTGILVVTGSVFCLLGGIGLHRFPDFYTRLHAAGMTDSLGAVLILIGLMFQSGFSLITVKLVTIIAFAYLTSPAATHALAKAAFSDGVKVEGVLKQHERGGRR